MNDANFARLLANLSPEKRAILAEMLRPAPDPIAIVGLACRFPGGANSPEAFWDLLENGRDAITPIPADRWPVEEYYDADPAAPGKMNSRYGAFLDQVDQFDAAFFGISPREAIRMDPQQRLFLEVAWEALESAGQSQTQLAGSNTGVFAGVYQGDYSWFQFDDVDKVDAYVASGMSHAIVANRLSYLFDLKGPSLAIDTACSSSLVAFHLACQSLRHKACDMALAGGVNLILSPLFMLPVAKWGMLAPDGRCKTFDAGADGMVRGEGCGVVVLKRLADARRDGDRILAVCRGTAANQDGRTNALTAPNGLSQREVIAQALQDADLPGSQISYVEAHGTGTALGDPIEMKALQESLGRDRTPDQLCLVGSVKTNIGHLEAAAGIAGLIKVILCLQHKTIPQHLHFRQLNPHINLDDVPFAIPTEKRPWSTANGQPRRAGVSSFGFGGSNAHAILEEAEQVTVNSQQLTVNEQRSSHLLVLSAPQAAALPALAVAYRERLSDDVALEDICHSAARRRTHFNHRLAVAGGTKEELATALDTYLNDADHPLLFSGQRPAGKMENLVFIYSGQGAQWAGMGRQLYAQEAVFHQKLDECDALLRPYLPQPLLSILFAAGQADAASPLNETLYAQPAIFAIQVGLTALWQSRGIWPAAVAGHSLGEVTAAYVAGALSLDDAIKIVAERSRLMQTITGQGQMATVALSSAQVRRYLADYPQLSLAAVNSPGSMVVSGNSQQLAALLAEWERQGIHARRLPVNYAFHSPQVLPLADELSRSLAAVRPQPAVLPLFSTVTGGQIQGEQLDGVYWAQNMTEPVLLSPVVERLIKAGHTDFLEIAPHPVLSINLRQCLDTAGQSGTVAASLRRDRDEGLTLLANLGALYSAGYTPDWDALYGHRGRYVPLPTYSWQRKRYWLESNGRQRPQPAAKSTPPLHPLLDRQISSPLLDGVLFEKRFSAEEPAFMIDHRIHGRLIIPATAYLEMVTAAAQILFGPGSHRLQEMVVRAALPLPEPGGVTVQLAFSPSASKTTAVQPGQAAGASAPLSAGFQIFARSDEEETWQLYVQGRVLAGAETAVSPPPFDLEAVRARCPEEMSGSDYYAQGEPLGARFGPRFQPIQRLWYGAGEALARLEAAPVLAAEMAGYRLHPALADALFHIVYAARFQDTAVAEMFLPLTFDDLCYYRAAGTAAWCHFALRAVAPDGSTMLGDVRLFDDDGQLLAEATGIRYRRAPKEATFPEEAAKAWRNWLYQVEWQPQAATAAATIPNGQGWLILADELEYGAALADALQARGYPAALVHIEAGAEFSVENGNQFRIAPENAAHYEQLLASDWAQQLPEGYQIVYLAGFNDQQTACAPRPSSFVLRPSLYLSQAAVRQTTTAPPRLWFVTRQAQPAAGDEPLNLAGAPLWGFGRVLALEHAQLWGGLIDLDDRPPAETAVLLTTELTQPDGEDQIAWRAGQRLVARLTHLSAGQAASEAAQSPVAPDATYLITGALGAIGRELARWLVGQGARHLALLGRSGATPDEEPFLAELRQAGAAVAVYAADVADGEQLSAVWSEISANQPPVKGIFHAAGVAADGTIAQIEWPRLAENLAAKVNGAWHLHQLAAGQPLDYFVLFSSGAAVLGSPGQSGYAAANAFMDGLAHYRRQQQLPALSVNWGAWDRGMAAAVSEERRRHWQNQGMGTLSPAEALAALAWLLRRPQAQVALLPLQAVATDSAMAAHLRQRPLLRQLTGRLIQQSATAPTNGRTPQSFAAKLSQVPARRRKQMVADFLRDQLGQVMGWDADYEVDPQQGLFDVGLDSLMAMELKGKLERDLGLAQPLPFTLIFDYPTLANLADYLYGEMMGAEDSTASETGDGLDALSEEELLELLAQEMENG